MQRWQMAFDIDWLIESNLCHGIVFTHTQFEIEAKQTTAPILVA